MSAIVSSRTSVAIVSCRRYQTTGEKSSRGLTKRAPAVGHPSLSARISQNIHLKNKIVKKDRTTILFAQVSASSMTESDADWKIIAKAEIPALVPREDLLDQLLKWSIIEFEENGRRNFGNKMVVDICDEYTREDGTPTAFAVKLKDIDGVGANIEVLMDNEVVEVEKNGEGFAQEKEATDPNEPPNPFAMSYDIIGKNLIIRRKAGELPESLVPLIREVVGGLSRAINTYYAFGSVYADDST
mmetsp:Transcript_5532/g.7478  ORF Transcript_5532/g.7478 Transcript_5532/m.7478 type:complete len:243 (+) Transcript_5532:68-796(+)